MRSRRTKSGPGRLPSSRPSYLKCFFSGSSEVLTSARKHSQVDLKFWTTSSWDIMYYYPAFNRKIAGFSLCPLPLLHRRQARVLVWHICLLLFDSNRNLSSLSKSYTLFLQVGLHLRPQDAQFDHAAVPPDKPGEQRGGGAQVHRPWQTRALQLHCLCQKWLVSR